MILLPEKYNDIELLKEEKLFINSIKNKLDNSSFALLKIKAIKEAINNIVILKEGACFIESIAIDNIQMFNMMISFIFQRHDSKVNIIKDKLLTHRLFNDENRNLNIAINYKYYITKLSRLDIDENISDEKIKKFINSTFIFKDEITKQFKTKENIINTLLDRGSIRESIDQESNRLDTFIHMIAPEYTIPIYDEVESKNLNNKLRGMLRKNLSDYEVKHDSLDVKVFRLDRNQINLINSIKPGHKLMLACAGSGKSVLLISKCFKIASIHENEDPKKNKKFLLTCYNKNLNDMYNWRVNTAGFRERNVDCITFHKLCKSLLDEIGYNYDPTDFDALFELARKKLYDGTIKRRYYGIFIDEVQVFKPEWYEFCYDLLENKTNNDYFFVVCGDKSQDIADNMKKGKAPWQGNDRLPSFKGHSIRLETNYRNSIQINSYINRFTEIAKNYASKLNIALKEDKDYILRGTSIRNGNNPTIVKSDRYNESQQVLDLIKDLNENKGIELYDIAVLFGQRQYKNQSYFIYNWVKDKLNEEGIDYSELAPPVDEFRTSYGYRQGVTLCTVNSALGLDFKAVIICGLKPMGSHLSSNNEQSLLDVDEQRIDDFIKNINTLYTGCTRARDELAIVVTEDSTKSIYSKILIEAAGDGGILEYERA
ncbi:DEAD/DEAH box helicase [Paraclostridium sordellii]|uniref:DEAD/DEAH box helicase n=1 Tax=Paraclostridium sordellii TaxID=1505 RepID=UPI001C6165F1|nr:AAA family ATPase [Paeniclostridium sordellii]QYE99103.1 AAA family ATPase [Paeniclostridium sordellii]